MKICRYLALSAGMLAGLLGGCGGKAASLWKGPAPVSGAEEAGTAILVVSFGTSYNDSREKTIGAIEAAIKKAFPQYGVRRAFTSRTIIRKLSERDGLEIDDVAGALARAAADGIKRLIVQPTHLMDGLEYTALMEQLDGCADMFDQIVVGTPLLTSDGDLRAVISAITADTAGYDDGKTAVVFMGHGTEAASNAVYARLQAMLAAQGYSNCYVGTVEAEPGLDDVAAALAGAGYDRVVLEPLMVVAGDHANNDMAGDGEDSWKSVLTARGYEVECLIRGLGENEAIRQIYVSHVRAAAAKLEG